MENINGKLEKIKIILKNGEHFYIKQRLGGFHTLKEKEKRFENILKSYDDLNAVGIKGWSGRDINSVKIVSENEGKIGF